MSELVNNFMISAAEFVPPEIAQYGKRYAKRWLQSVVNLDTLRYWQQLFYTAAISRFEWTGLPEGVTARWLETCLFSNGVIALSRVDGLPRFWIGRPSQQNTLDANNDFNYMYVLANTGYGRNRHANFWSNGEMMLPPDATVCWDNQQRMPLAQLIDIDCRRLATLDSVFMQHVNALRVPYVIQVPEEGKKNAEAMFDNLMSGQPAVYLNPSAMANIGITAQQTMPSNAYAGDKLLNDQLKIVSRVYTMLGIDNNAAAEKKERVQTSETLANNEQFMIQRNAALKSRLEFCRSSNELFGTSIDVRWSVRHVGESANDGQTIENGGEYGANVR